MDKEQLDTAFLISCGVTAVGFVVSPLLIVLGGVGIFVFGTWKLFA